MADTLYKRLGGYDAIAAVADDLLVRPQADPRLARFWQHRSEDSLLCEKQTLINFLCASAGGPLYYVGRDMKVSHKGLGIDESDWQAFTGHLDTTLGSGAGARRSAELHQQHKAGHLGIGLSRLGGETEAAAEEIEHVAGAALGEDVAEIARRTLIDPHPDIPDAAAKGLVIGCRADRLRARHDDQRRASDAIDSNRSSQMTGDARFQGQPDRAPLRFFSAAKN